MATTQTIPTGIGVLLDQKRRSLPTRQRSWLGQAPRNSNRRIPLAEGMEGIICTGDFAGIDNHRANFTD